MTKITVSLLALAALSGAAFANDRTEEGTIASRNVGAETTAITEQAGAGVVSDTQSEVTDFVLIKRYGIEPNTGNGND